MDPVAALIAYLEAAAIPDTSGMSDANEALRDWYLRDGFVPVAAIRRAIDAIKDGD